MKDSRNISIEFTEENAIQAEDTSTKTLKKRVSLNYESCKKQCWKK